MKNASVAHAPADRRVGGGHGVEHGADRGGLRHVDVDGGRATGVGPQAGRQPDDDLQGSTAVFTHTTGGRYVAICCHDAPASGEANTSPVRVPM